MARMPGHPGQEFSDERSTNTLSWDFVERVTRIELALSAWEAQRLPLPGAPTSQVGWPVVAVVVPSSPWLMAR
jgi:hypothetical protein